MDRPEQPEQPSIFSRPDRETDDDLTIRGSAQRADRDPESVASPAWDDSVRPVRDPLYPRRPAYPRGQVPPERQGPSRQVLLAFAGGGLSVVLGAAFIVMNALGGDPTVAAASPTPAEDPVATASPSPSVSASPSVSPIPTPPPAPETLAASEWATILADTVNVHASASLGAAVTGTASRGEIVMIDDSGRVKAEGLSWYHAIVSPGLAGWIAGHDETDQFALSDAATTSVRWCAVPDGGTFEVEEPTYQTPGETYLLDTAHVGGLPVSTGLLGPAGSGIVELAWGTQDQVCLDLAITDGRTAAIGLSASIEGCGSPYYGPSMRIQFGTGSVSAGGQTDSRLAVIDATVIGFDFSTAGQRPNLADVFQLASNGGSGDATLCVTASASGRATAPSIAFEAGTTQCAWVSSRTSSAITLSYPDNVGEWVELRLTPDSFVGDGVTAQSNSYSAEKGFRVSAKRGVEGSVGISVRALEGCGS